MTPPPTVSPSPPRTSSGARQSLELEALLEAAVDAIVIIDHRGHIEVLNRAAERLFGFTREEVIGRNVSALMPEPDRSSHDAYLSRYLNTGIPHIIGIGREVNARRKDGTVFPVSLAVGQIAAGQADQPPRFVGFIHDITLRREAIAAVQRERDRANQYLEAAQTMLVAINADGRVSMINRKGCEVLNESDRELVGSDWWENVEPADRNVAQVRLTDLLRQPGNDPCYLEYRVRRPDTTNRLIAWRCVPLRDVQSHIIGVLCSGEDVTEARRVEEETRRSQERLTHVARLATMGEMAAGIAHELNQPLAAIANYAQASERFLRHAEPDLEEVRGALQQISAQALRAGEIIRRLRSLVRKQDTARARLQINDLIQELGTLTSTDARLHDVRLQFDPRPGLPEAWIDPVQIQQVLLNLVRNAIEAVEGLPAERRRIIIRTGLSAPGEIEVTVTDSGPGVEPQVLERLFDPFCTTKPAGTGLGLAISRSIVTAHKGTLRYEPVEPHGARFVLRLPAIIDDMHRAEDTPGGDS